MTTAYPMPLSRTMISFIETGRNLPGLESLSTLATVLHVDPLEVLEVLRVSTAPTTATDLGLEELRRRAEKLFWAGDYQAALATYDAMLDQLLRDPPEDEDDRVRLHARIEVNRATTLRRCGALNSAQATAQRALSLAESLPALQAEAYVILAATLVEKGCLPLARDTADRAVALSRSASASVKCRAHNQRGDALFMSGAYSEALRAFETARGHAIESDDRHHRTKAEGNIGACLAELGQVEDAEARYREAVRLARASMDPQAQARWMLELGVLAYQDGRIDEADRFAADTLKIARPRDFTLLIFRAEWLRHRVVLERAPKADDRRRLDELRRLLTRLHPYREVDEVRHFRKLQREESS